MIANQPTLSRKQISSFDRLLLDGTSKALSALENMFVLSVDCSNSTIEITTAANSEILNHLGNGTLYVVSSAMAGDLQGSALLLMRSNDFNLLGKAMRPVLSLMFLSSPEADLATLDSQKPDWMHDDDTQLTTDEAFHHQMMDMLVEMGNVFIGLYTKAIYKMCRLNTHHSVPVAVKDPGQRVIKRVLSSAAPDQLHLLIENEFFVMDKPIKLWCLISPTQVSFQKLLNRMERRNKFHYALSGEPGQVESRFL